MTHARTWSGDDPLTHVESGAEVDAVRQWNQQVGLDGVVELGVDSQLQAVRRLPHLINVRPHLLQSTGWTLPTGLITTVEMIRNNTYRKNN